MKIELFNQRLASLTLAFENVLKSHGVLKEGETVAIRPLRYSQSGFKVSVKVQPIPEPAKKPIDIADMDERCALLIKDLGLPQEVSRRIYACVTLGGLARMHPEDIVHYGVRIGTKTIAMILDVIRSAGLVPGAPLPIGPKEREAVLNSSTRELGYPVNNLDDKFPTIRSLTETTRDQIKRECTILVESRPHFTENRVNVEDVLTAVETRLEMFELALRA